MTSVFFFTKTLVLVISQLSSSICILKLDDITYNEKTDILENEFIHSSQEIDENILFPLRFLHSLRYFLFPFSATATDPMSSQG